jgi:hypothetical protein
MFQTSTVANEDAYFQHGDESDTCFRLFDAAICMSLQRRYEAHRHSHAHIGDNIGFRDSLSGPNMTQLVPKLVQDP